MANALKTSRKGHGNAIHIVMLSITFMVVNHFAFRAV